MESPFERALASELDTAYPQVYDRLEALDTLPEDVAGQVICILLTRACQSQNVGNIQASRRAIGRIPHRCRLLLLPKVIDQSLTLEDEWEFRRLVELLREIEPSLAAHYVSHGMASGNHEVREAASDYQQG
jgi:hypothetical protein